MKMSASELPGYNGRTSVDIELPLGEAAEDAFDSDAEDAPDAVAQTDKPIGLETDLAPLHHPHRQPPSPLGTLLLALGALSMEDIERILAHQKQHGLRFGESAVRLKLVTPTDIQRALAKQFSFPYLVSPPDAKTLSTELVAAYQPFGAATEYLRGIRSQLVLRWHRPAEQKQVLAVVGARRGEGRSYLAANLAILFAQMGERTLLIDADLREPRQHELFMLQNTIGLSTALAGISHEDASVGIVEIPGLFVLPAGPVPPNPVELLHGRLFDLLLRKARSSFGAVIIDTPSVARGEEVFMLASRSDAALAVASSRSTRSSEFRQMITSMQDAGVPVVGSVLNEATRRGSPVR